MKIFHILLKISVIVFIAGLLLTLDLNAYTEKLTADGPRYISGLIQVFPGGRVDTLLPVLEKVNPSNIWITFGTTLRQ